MATLALAKQHLRVLHDDEDAIIQQYIDASVAEVETLSGQLMTRREVSQSFAAFSDWLPLDYGPLPEAIEIVYVDTDDAEQTIADALYVRGRVYPDGDEWPDIADNTQITVTYTAGWEEAPAGLVQAALVLIAGRYSSREGAYDEALRAAESLCGRVRAQYV